MLGRDRAGARKDGKEGRERERWQEGGRSAQAGIKKLGCKSVHGNYATGVKREEKGGTGNTFRIPMGPRQ